MKSVGEMTESLIPPYQKVSTSGCLTRKDRILLVRRSKCASFLPGYYELPGGKVEFGEEPKDALAREFFEETGLQVHIEKPFRVCSYLLEDGKRQNIEIIYSATLKDLSHDQVRLSSEHDDFQWFTQDEALRRDDVSEQVKESVVMVFQGRKTSENNG